MPDTHVSEKSALLPPCSLCGPTGCYALTGSVMCINIHNSTQSLTASYGVQYSYSGLSWTEYEIVVFMTLIVRSVRSYRCIDRYSLTVSLSTGLMHTCRIGSATAHRTNLSLQRGCYTTQEHKHLTLLPTILHKESTVCTSTMCVLGSMIRHVL